MTINDKEEILKLFVKEPDLKIISLNTTINNMTKVLGFSETEIVEQIIEVNKLDKPFIIEYEFPEKIYTEQNGLITVWVYRYYDKTRLNKVVVKSKDDLYININDYTQSLIYSIRNGKLKEIFQYKDGRTETLRFSPSGGIKTLNVSKYKHFTDTPLFELNVNEDNIELIRGKNKYGIH